ncbi:MAG: hypothetical protein KBF89_00900 [Acidimicrobiia bacterium]|nr:hypothetical protein [Acidimicrobiia bacterium]
MNKKIKSVLIAIAIVVVSIIAINVTTNHQPYENRSTCDYKGGPTSGFEDENDCPYTIKEAKEITDYQASPIFTRQPVGVIIFFIAITSVITVLIKGLKNPKNNKE